MNNFHSSGYISIRHITNAFLKIIPRKTSEKDQQIKKSAFSWEKKICFEKRDDKDQKSNLTINYLEYINLVEIDIIRREG